MSKEVPWSKIILEEFIKEALLSKEEEWIMRTRCAGWPRTRQAEELGISMATLDRRIRDLKEKYDRVQKYDVLLPPRKESAEEKYMDEH